MTQLSLGRVGIHGQLCIAHSLCLLQAALAAVHTAGKSGEEPLAQWCGKVAGVIRMYGRETVEELHGCCSSFCWPCSQCGLVGKVDMESPTEIPTLIFASCWISRNCWEAQGKVSEVSVLSGGIESKAMQVGGWAWRERGGRCCSKKLSSFCFIRVEHLPPSSFYQIKDWTAKHGSIYSLWLLSDWFFGFDSAWCSG